MHGKGEKGEWKTINGAHVFVEDGQSVEDAMNKQFRKETPSKKQESKKELSTTQQMKAKLKESGIDTKQVSIREKNGGYSSAYYVKVKSPYIDLDEVERKVKGFESYERDERTNEILEGGNTYVFASYEDDIFDNVIQEHLPKAQKVMEEARGQKDGYGINIQDGVNLFNIGSCCELFVKTKGGDRQHLKVYDEKQLAKYMFQLKQFNKIVGY